MSILNHFSIPFLGLKNGSHEFIFDVDSSFFKEFEKSQIKSGSFKVFIELDKKTDHSEMHMKIDGYMSAVCDRCLDEFDLALSGDFDFIIKHGEGDPDDDEIIYLEHGSSTLNPANLIYECIHVLIPLIKSHKSIEDCNQEIIEKMSIEQDNPLKQELWEKLKGINLKDL
jgi:uncharacterized protein